MVGKPNFALGAEAFSPGTKDHAAIGPQGAVDGLPETYWDETDAQKSYQLRLTLPRPATVSAATILGYEHHNFAPRDFDLFIDGRALKHVTNAVYKDNVLLVRFPRTTGRVVELKVTGCYGKSPAIRELGLFDLEAKK